MSVKEENGMRGRAQRGRHVVTFADMNGQNSKSPPKSPPKDEKSGRNLRCVCHGFISDYLIV